MGIFSRETTEFDDRFEQKGRGDLHAYDYIRYAIIADKVTGVHYLVASRLDTGIGVTPLLDENGKVFIQKPGPEQE